MAALTPLKVGTRVEVIGKGVVGTIAYIGTTVFSAGKWIGVVLDEPRGKNNGTVQGKTYFSCPENHGIFVRQSQISALEDQTPPPSAISASPAAQTPAVPSSTVAATPSATPARRSGLRPPSGYMSKSTDSIEGALAAGDKTSTPAQPSISRIPHSKESTPEGEKPASVTKSSVMPRPTGLPKPASSTTPPPDKEAIVAEAPPPSPPKVSPHPLPTQMSEVTNLSTSIDEKLAAVQNQQEREGLQAEVRDLKEKLETLMLRRTEDKAKLKEADKLRIQLQQLQEYKSKMQETHAELQRQLQAFKKEAQDVRQEFDQYKDEMADVSESMEMAALDKEMAEEKAETLQQEVEQAKEKIEELTLELELLRGEISEKGSEGVAATFEMKQLEQQNERMKEGLVKMRDLLTSEKSDRQRLEKQNEKLQAEIIQLQRDKERLTAQSSELEKQVIELKEQVDAALGAEEMVEKLTDRNLQLEERIEALEEEKNDLEALNEMNEELQENARETELELREERDNTHVRLGECQRKLDAMQETMADYETTINKFRSLVAQLQEANKELRSKQLESESKAETPTIELFDFKAKFAETKAFAKTIDMELRRLEVQQATSHIKMLLSFMPEAFLGRGGDHDAICVLLMVPRIINKADLLASQVKDKFEVVEKIEKDHVLKGSKAEQFSFANHLVLLLSSLQTTMHQYESALNNCSVDLFIKVGTLLPEMSAHEKTLDHFIEMLRKDQLDETVSLEMLEKSIGFFQQLYTVHLSSERVDCTSLMCDNVRTVLSACDCVATDISQLKILLLPGQEQSEFSILLRDLETCNNDTRMCARKIKRRLPQEGSAMATPLRFGKDIQDLLLDSSNNITRVSRTLHAVCSGAMHQAAIMTAEAKKKDKEGILAKKMEELAYEATDKVYGKEDTGPYECLRMSFGIVVGTMNKLANAMENGEYDFDGTHDKKTLAPVRLRAEAMKNHFGDVEVMRTKLDVKDEELKEIKKQLKIKQEELSEQQVRLGLMEKKLENASKEADDRVEKIQRKLDEANVQFKKKEKEFEETYDTLQGEIDNLDQEKSELKERLRVLSKKTLLEGLTRQSSSHGTGQPPSPVGSTTGSTTSLTDSPQFIHQVESLREALQFCKRENIRLKAERMRSQLSDMPAIHLPVKPVGLGSKTGHVGLKELPSSVPGRLELGMLASKTGKLLAEANKLSACPSIVDITKRKPGTVPITDHSSPAQQLIQRTTRLTELERKTTELQVQVTTLLAANRTGGQVRTDFSTFPTPQFAKMLFEKSGESLKVGRIRVPCPGGKGDTIPVNIQPDQLHMIHARFLS
ncbi:dynactin subunit 1-like isoform X2 [Pomacea canaliculata]|uniref:dynactin subunit 1-like isoform X2 n=1 Tax=Pomacea canaliculata TaxID=400727 RepID=UPI000D73324F|nr:dynactin subunit 1-like isoform X2 [Pomacea canaliculata]